MKQFFIGFLLILLSFKINFYGGTLNLVPEFLGYYFVLKGLQQMKEESGAFARAVPAARFMIGYSFILWVIELLHLLWQNALVLMLLSFLGGVGLLYVLYHVIGGIRETETRCQADLGGKTLSVLWKLLIAVIIGTVVMEFVPGFFSLVLLKLLMIGLFVWTIAVLVKFYEGWRAWEKLQSEQTAQGPAPAVQLAKPVDAVQGNDEETPRE